MPQTSLSGTYYIDSLLSTYQWGSTNGTAQTLTYSFPTSGSTWLIDYYGGEPFSPNSITYLNSTQKQDFRDALQSWSEVANITFNEISEPGVQGDIRVTYSSSVTDSGFAGWAYEPPRSSLVSDEAGDVWLNPQKLDDLSIGTQGFSTLIHELGHALGFKHSFAEDPPNTTNPTILTGTEDTTQYTVMSYTDYEGAGWVEKGNTNYFVSKPNTTPMLYDIAAIQFLYGANTSTRTGDDTYTFSSTAADLKTIWDAGGNDSFDLSEHSRNLSINLNAGEYSSIGVINYELVGNTIQSTSKSAVNNIAIAYNVEIENAIGGSGNDTIVGNSLANQITGGAGNDTITGGDGDDTVIYTGNQSAYQIQTVGSNLQITSLTTNEGVDTLSGVEKLQFADQLVDATTLSVIGSIPTKTSEVVTNPSEGDTNHTNYFLLQIGAALSVDATVDYTTRDGTALAGSDYVATSGTATIKAGETTTVIGIEIIADTISESDETFLLAITNPTGASFPSGTTEITASRTIVDDDVQLRGASADIFSEIQIIGVDDSLPI